jgi:SnoaL-like domain
MRSNGSVYVAVVAAALVGYFSYQWWFNPNRAVKQRLGELAAAASVPVDEPALDRLSRPARVRAFFADDATIRLGDAQPAVESPDSLAAAITAWSPPPGGVTIAFVDVQVNVDSRTTARAYLTVEVTTRDESTGQPSFENHEAKVALAKRDGVWLITSAEPNEAPSNPTGP